MARCGFLVPLSPAVRSGRNLLFVGCVLLILTNATWAQTEGLGNTTSTPVAGVPHDYILGLNEIVNPANGSVSVRIPQPYPHERNPNWPRYAFMYDSNLQVSKMPNWFVSSNGNNNFQNVTAIYYLYQPPEGSSSSNLTACLSMDQGGCTQYGYCTVYNNYMQIDPSGGRHALGIQQYVPGVPSACSSFGLGPTQLQGGDSQYKANLVSGGSGGVTVWDLHGNSVADWGASCGSNPNGLLVEDVNGNLCDTTGRTAPLPTPDTTTTETLTFPSSLTFPVTVVGQGVGPNGVAVGCNIPNNKITTTTPDTFTATSSVTLPNGEQYLFQYDPTYQLLSKITYPTGATVTYTWSTIPNAEGVQYQPTLQQGYGALCAVQYSWFAITKRVVSFDGVNNAQEQDFSYTTTWPTQPSYKWVSKSTTVITKDLIRETQFETVYNYLPMLPPQSSYPAWVDLGYMPVENTTTYYDTSGSLLKTDTKVWGNIDQMTAECETLANGQTSGKFYQYQVYTPTNWSSYSAGETTDLPTDVAEYDYGTVASGGCVQPSSTPIRETKTTYWADLPPETVHGMIRQVS